MSGRFRVGAALAGVVVLTAAGLVAANWATAETRTKPTGQKSDPVGRVTERSPLVGGRARDAARVGLGCGRQLLRRGR